MDQVKYGAVDLVIDMGEDILVRSQDEMHVQCCANTRDLATGCVIQRNCDVTEPK